MDILISWESVPWNEPEGEAEAGYRAKTCVREGHKVWLVEFTEGHVPQEWCTQEHLFHVLAGECTLRLREGDRAIRMRAGDTGIIPAGEAYAHNMEPVAGERIQLLLFDQA